jgi:hypothetical protein
VSIIRHGACINLFEHRHCFHGHVSVTLMKSYTSQSMLAYRSAAGLRLLGLERWLMSAVLVILAMKVAAGPLKRRWREVLTAVLV